MKLIELNDLSEAYTSSGSKEKKDNTFKTTMKKLHNGATKVIGDITKKLKEFEKSDDFFYSADDKMEAGEAEKNFNKELKKRYKNAIKSPGGHDSVSWMENGKKVYGNDTSWMYKGKLVAGSYLDEDKNRNWVIYSSTAN